MLANRVKETSTTSGTGNLTLAGAETNFRTFNTAFGTDYRFYYTVIDDTANTWESGIGYLSASTTLVRETVLDNHLGTTAAISFASNSKTVICSPPSGSIDVNIPAMSSTNRPYLKGSNWVGALSVSTDVRVDYIYYVPVKLEYEGSADALICNVTTAAASSKIRLGVYEVAADGEPGNLIQQTADIDSSTTGEKVSTFTAIHLKSGWYFFGFATDDSTVRVSGISPSDSCSDSPLGYDSSDLENIPFAQESLGASWTVLPSAAGTLTFSDVWRNVPAVFIRTA